MDGYILNLEYDVFLKLQIYINQFSLQIIKYPNRVLVPIDEYVYILLEDELGENFKEIEWLNPAQMKESGLSYSEVFSWENYYYEGITIKQ